MISTLSLKTILLSKYLDPETKQGKQGSSGETNLSFNIRGRNKIGEGTQV